MDSASAGFRPSVHCGSNGGSLSNHCRSKRRTFSSSQLATSSEFPTDHRGSTIASRERSPTRATRLTSETFRSPEATGVLFCGDNLEVLTDHVAANSVDLVYLDPPCPLHRTHHIDRLDRGDRGQFKEQWTWAEAEPSFDVALRSVPRQLKLLLRALREQ